MTTLTTAAGLLSFGFAELAAIAELGIFAAAGVMLVLFYTIVLLPALLAILPIQRKTEIRKTTSKMDGVITAFADFSVNDIVKEINRALHGNDPAYYTIPQERDLIAQELLFFENSGSSDLDKVVDNQSAITRIAIKTPWVDSVFSLQPSTSKYTRNHNS